MNFEIIAKFGGTSVARPDLVREHVGASAPAVVVVSAPGSDRRRSIGVKVTDLLLAYKNYEGDETSIQNRFIDLAEDMDMLDGESFRLIHSLEGELRSRRARGYPLEILGERYAAQFYARFLGREYVDATEIIRVDTSGQPLVEPTTDLIRSRLRPSGRYVVPGFYGADFSLRPQPMGRGSSDVTPALISRALGASECHIWSDVDGFMTSDPASNANAEVLGELDYAAALAMAEAGCPLLHPLVCRLLGDTAVTTVIRNTFGHPDNCGTVIKSELAASYHGAIAIMGARC